MIMEMYSKCLLFILCSLCLLHVIAKGSDDDQRKLYIVYMGELPEVKTSLIEDHNKLLVEAIGDEKLATQAKVYSYRRSLNGFAARLLPHEADRLSQNENVVSVFPSDSAGSVSRLLMKNPGVSYPGLSPSMKRHLLTTRSWDFLGMPVTVERNATAESDIIVGLLDTGIYIPSKSFSDAGYGPPPPKSKGVCQKGDNFTGCNNKVIGARYFDLEGNALPGQVSPADFEGHGTHTASTVAGVPVEHASLYGIAEGTARGGVPQARIAMYKVCSSGCSEADILAGFDAAIADGVDILSISLGGGYGLEYLEDVIAIGSFHAVKKGIFVSAAAGNSGPSLSTVDNVAPWILTVAASTIDRVITTPLELGNGKMFNGTDINLEETEGMQPLMNGDIDVCLIGSEEEKKNVQGKIVYCKSGYEQCNIKRLGGSGIITRDVYLDVPELTCETATRVSEDNGKEIETYMNSTTNPLAKIYRTRDTWTEEAPWIASFSSRGPDTISKKILKPDLAAPGDAILAAYSELTTLSEETGDENDTRRVGYFIESGTSMACPHAASAIAYIKSFHPEWSPAALKSALMTTATPMKKEQKGAELASGSGNINPVGAVDPGLVYDMDADYYISFLCQHGYNDTQIAGITGNKTTKCSDYPLREGYDGLNYPSIHYQLTSPNDTVFSAVFYRTVTHVGEGESKYMASIVSTRGVYIDVVPNTLYFFEKGQKASFKVMVKGEFLNEKQWYLSGSLVWKDSKHSVNTPVVVYRPQESDT